jgi:hypothetical protein
MSQPVQVTVTPTTTSRKPETDAETTTQVVFFAICCLILIVSLAVAWLLVWHCKFGLCQCEGNGNSQGREVNNLLGTPLMAEMHDRAQNNDTRTTRSANIIGLSTIDSSPALIFAINREMHIVSWSPGACDLCRCDVMVFHAYSSL